MAIVRAFRGLRYVPERVGAVGSVTCPPYDVMDPAAQQRFHAQNPYNVVRLELGLDQAGDNERENRYTRAAALLTQWREAGVLRQEESPCLYRYVQTFRDAAGAERTRCGMLALLRLEPLDSGVVLPHEETFPHHKEDRFRLLSACRAQISPILGLFRSDQPELHAELRSLPDPPALDFVDEEEVRHQLTLVRDADRIRRYVADLRDRQVFIADGHHRYETALRYRATRRGALAGRTGEAAGEAWYDYVMIVLVEMGDPGLVTFPTHRLVRAPRLDWERLRSGLGTPFRVEALPLPTGPEAAALLEQRTRRGTIVVVTPPGETALLLALADPSVMVAAAPDRSPAWRALDVAVLHRLILPRVRELAGGEVTVAYTRDAAAALAAARRGDAAAFLVPAATVEDLRAVSLCGERMPEKSTYFFPKARTGLVIYGE